MATIGGWVSSSAMRDAIGENAAQIAAELAHKGFVCQKTKAGNLYARKGETASSAQSAISATVCGRFRWNDAELERQARIHGNAQALLTVYQKHGTDCLRLLSGDFALAIVDSVQHSALLAIDRMGIQALCYTVTTNGGLVFGTTTDLLRIHPDVGSAIAPQALFDYVYFHLVPSPGTIYQHIRKLEPGQYLVYRDGKTQCGRYWRPDFHEQERATNSKALEVELRATLRASVERCAPDNYTGAYLSGGLDSSTVCGLLAEARGEQSHAFTIGFAATGYDEMEYARIAARHFNLKLHEYYVTPADIVEAIPRVARAYDEPFGNSSAIPALFCAQLAREHGMRTLLAGDGGDEIFGGNTRYVKQKVFDVYGRVPGWIRGALLEPLLLRPQLIEHLPLLRKARSYIEQARQPMPDRAESYNYLHRIARETIFEGDFLKSIDARHPLALLDRVYGEASAKSLLNRMLYLDWKFTLADNDLRKVVKTCELADMEVRFPMLDDALVDFSLRVPPELKIKGFKLRHFYKQAMNDFLPAAITHKSKHGFGLPFGEWLKTSTNLQELVYASLHELKKRGIIRAAFIDTLIATQRNDHAAYYGTMIWVLVLLEQWFHQHDMCRLLRGAADQAT